MRVAMIAILIAALSACGTTSAPEPLPAVSADPSAVPGQSPAPGKSPAPATSEVAALPDVVGMNHQSAQDALQAAGFYYLTEEDATGQGRLLVSDRNWVVVEQVPAAGTKVAKTEKILLRSKKKGD
ncbi:PASTA domain-containing protein [Actinokineospora alba]|uniref:PASTA domain-containing protein n=1 Tax=Actinokineospora alba TaxID=504798 RepID=A0A1H0WL92_9PSEU|nr:PASTA domain-containing protein [Actinokineospora alba]TDP66253.1 PASTA domain-containing protein [Actinokineospora alba]SDJ44084.1 PASTA domain-containing protein [Actinokineospora alba]SDP91492.1 PASTA domain-containing protein [Actinokineospora alba]